MKYHSEHRILVLFNLKGVTAEILDDTEKELRLRGRSVLKGRTLHIVSQKNNGWLIADVWENHTSMQDYLNFLHSIVAYNLPIPLEPTIFPLYALE